MRRCHTRIARRCRPRIAGVLLATIAASLLAAGCGSSSPGSSHPGNDSAQSRSLQAQREAVRFASCMRSHGAPGFPDAASPRAFKKAMSPGAPASSSPAFQSAANACRHLLPRGKGPAQESAAQRHAHVVAALAFAGCMRGHGFQRFPDPNTSGQITHAMLADAGIDIHQPAAVQTADTCVGVTHGVLTKADVARFVAGR